MRSYSSFPELLVLLRCLPFVSPLAELDFYLESAPLREALSMLQCLLVVWQLSSSGYF